MMVFSRENRVSLKKENEMAKRDCNSIHILSGLSLIFCNFVTD